eukprot:scaffold120320_cov33-Tisochrysis_lutea.AAC.1
MADDGVFGAFDLSLLWLAYGALRSAMHLLAVGSCATIILHPLTPCGMSLGRAFTSYSSRKWHDPDHPTNTRFKCTWADPPDTDTQIRGFVDLGGEAEAERGVGVGCGCGCGARARGRCVSACPEEVRAGSICSCRHLGRFSLHCILFVVGALHQVSSATTARNKYI